MWESVLEELGKLPDVKLAYPTQRVFTHAENGSVRAG
jgi:hypothetical protein